MRKFSAFLSLILVLGLALAACSPATTQNTPGPNGTEPAVFVTTTANGVTTLPAPGGVVTESVTNSAATETAATSPVTEAVTTSSVTEAAATSAAITATVAAPASTAAVSTEVVTPSVAVSSTASTSAPSAAIPILPGTGGDMMQASNILSATVNDKTNQQVGTVQDLILNLATRHVDYLLVRSDSASHPTSAPDLEVTPAPNYNVVSWQAVTGISGNALTLNVDATTVNGAPLLERRAVPFLTPSDWKAAFDSYWKRNLPTPTAATTATATAAVTAAPGSLSGYMLAGDILGQSLQTPNGQQVGSVKDLLVNVKTGEVAYLLLSTGPASGVGQKLIPVPLQLLGQKVDTGVFTLTIPPSALNLAPSIDPNNLPASTADWINNLTTFWKTYVK